MSETMVEKYGRGMLAQIVSSFYGNVLRSPRLAHYFAEASIVGLIEHQSRFLAMVMGGPPAYTDAELEAAHLQLDIAEADFDEMLRLLAKSLDSYDIDPADIAQVIARYRETQSSVVSLPTSGPDTDS